MKKRKKRESCRRAAPLSRAEPPKRAVADAGSLQGVVANACVCALLRVFARCVCVLVRARVCACARLRNLI